MEKPLEAEGALKAVSTFAGKRINTETFKFVFPTDVVCVSVHVWISLRCQIPGVLLS